ncbi:hypothetical protein [Nonomuraea sp. KM90]|uniref:hypothetical protein n=1 Tax=Nonomuraea sp. KM90 TaxID=3457428 RepID=UPI003FCCB5BE
MNTATTLGTYALALAVVFGGAFSAGKVAGPMGTPAAESHSAMQAPSAAAGREGHATQPAKEAIPGGLQVSQNGYTLNPLTAEIKAGEPTDFRFTVTGPDDRPVTDFQVVHDKKLHFIVVPRDLGGFQHLHPEMTPDGVWSVKLTLPSSGLYRAFADFAPARGSALTLGTDLSVAGDYEPQAFPQVSRTSTVDGYTVTLDGELTLGRATKITLKVSKDGKPVTDLQPYLGVYGHLVALRARDLAYLHIHPDGELGDGKTKPGPEIVFYAEVPSVGDYRLFLDFKHEGKVRTADFTLGAGQKTPLDLEPTTPPTPTPTASGHGDDHNH